MGTNIRISPVRRTGLSAWRFAAACLSVAVLAAACGGTTGSPLPSSSLVPLDFTPLPTGGNATVAPSRSPARSSAVGSWPIGWDVAFCNAFTDLTVVHELVIDIERAINDDARDDAAALGNELAQTVPIAQTELTRTTDWEPAADLKTQLLAILDLDALAAASYQSYFNDEVRSALREARQTRNQISKAVPDANEQLALLTDAGLGCPGTDLQLETF